MSSDQPCSCPLCFQPVAQWPQYPLAVCLACVEHATDALGRKLKLLNPALGAGFEVTVADTGEAYQSQTCYIRGVECRVAVARLDAVVIEAARKSIGFYHLDQPYGFCSNFAPYPIRLKDKIWATSEHYFQAQKFAGTVHEEQVQQAPTPRLAAEMGRDRNRPLRPDWHSIKDATMREAVYAKFTQHPNLTTKLLATGEARLVEHTRNDSYWGDGGDGHGKNRLGLVLMEIRTQIRQDLCHSPSAIAEMDTHNLQRFIEAQANRYQQVMAELAQGHKRSHWMWYIFPQFAGLGSSPTSQKYAIKSRAEAQAYLNHPVLGTRLVECTETVLRLKDRSAQAIFGTPDDLKLHSCATLFATVGPPESVFEQVLYQFFQGKRDEKTLHLLARSDQSREGSI